MAPMRIGRADGYFGKLTFLKKLFWLYFLLLIFEGALRKWVAPQLSAPLLIVRDPVALMIVWEAYRTHKWPIRWGAVIALLTVMLVTLFGIQIVAGGNPLIVGLYGLRSYLLPFPVLFIMGENLDDEDLRKMGVCTLWLLLPMTLVEVGQYLTPTGSFLNRGAYEGGAQIGYVGEHVRSSGTFSFAIGVVHFDTLAAALILYGMVRQGFAKKWILWASAFALIISIPTTGARVLVYQLAAVIACAGLGALMGVSQFGRVIRVILSVAILVFLASFLPVFSEAMKSMTDRISEANAVEGGGTAQGALIYRTVQPGVIAFEEAASTDNWLGIGMGRGAAAMQALLYGRREFAAGENEVSREISEMGPIAGTAFILFKVFLAITIFGSAMARLREQEPLALLIFPLAAGTLFFGVFEQPTLQGFMVIGTAFCIAAGRAPVTAAVQMPQFALNRQQMLQRRRIQRS